MSTTISNAFIKQYESEVHHVFQLQGAMLLPAIRWKPNVTGTTATFQKIGKGTATTKARHGTITPMNQTHTAIEATMVDFYAGDWVDKLDEAKINIDERKALAMGGAWALGRKVDNQIITAMDGTSQTVQTLVITSYATILQSMLEWVEDLDSNDVPNDGGRYGLVTPRLWSNLMTVEEFASADYVGANGMPFTEGPPVSQRWKYWNGVLWKNHTGLPGIKTATGKGFIWHKNAVGYGSTAAAGNIAGNGSVSADITWHGDRAAHFVNHLMSGGATLIDDTGVFESNWDDTSVVAAS